MSSSPVPPPDLGIPLSTSTVSISIINTTTTISGLASSIFYVPSISGAEKMSCPAFSFLIRHPSNRSLLFDLGVRPDHSKEDVLPPALISRITKMGAEITVEKGVRQILEEGGFDAKQLEAVIWSHWHFDHVGDPSTFEPHTALIVGPGFKSRVGPGYPANPEATFLESDYAGRELREISFEEEGVVEIGEFKAFDYFGDGSFYLLDTPGHAIGHLSGLARVTSNPDSFIFMGGDACHHVGELRPSQYLPLPPNISPNPFTCLTSPSTPCPGSLFSPLLPDGDNTKPFYGLSNTGSHFDVDEAAKTIEKIQGADVREDVLVVLAHDNSLTGVVDFFPQTANSFMEKGWVKKLRWLFLREFGKAVGYEREVEGLSDEWLKWNAWKN
ncbi:hypothetical protein GQ43DRAFT_441758 [Delitschia confertaspora ATCC 74209]|uniref:Metallo-beta-lactamase domain-containing protein n=1 Tax=Delitschia confertaspora ATCC 74209 TaxID=1513339 RepID=A0A9P4JIU2_9PLEO|nr:hypothetical protein GQ43DRAFT_441758 [Delitschia confertaspora ATCC 74209]